MALAEEVVVVEEEVVEVVGEAPASAVGAGSVARAASAVPEGSVARAASVVPAGSVASEPGAEEDCCQWTVIRQDNRGTPPNTYN